MEIGILIGSLDSILQLQYFRLHHRLNMEIELQSVFGLHVHSCSHCWDLPPSPRFWAHIRERYWSVKIENISLFVTSLGTPFLERAKSLYGTAEYSCVQKLLPSQKISPKKLASLGFCLEKSNCSIRSWR